MKLKTSKSAKKRFRISARGNMQHRRVNMNHFNAKDSGNERRHKRLQKDTIKTFEKNMRQVMPYLSAK